MLYLCYLHEDELLFDYLYKEDQEMPSDYSDDWHEWLDLGGEA